MPRLYTTLGPLEADKVGMILPHEHIFVDLRTPDIPEQGQADIADVQRLMAPQVRLARAAGVSALVDSGPVGVGRRSDAILAVSQLTAFPILIPTGVYREPWIPDWIKSAPVEELEMWMTSELEEQIEDTGVKAGWIKLSAGDDGLTPTEIKILRAAARAGKHTGAVIGSHTIRGRVANDQLDIIEQEGYSPERFIWIHAHNEGNLDLVEKIARRGTWIEYDAIGSAGKTDAFFLERIRHLLDANLGRQVLLSHDRGWYDPAKLGGGIPRPFTYISQVFLPYIQREGIHQETIRMLTESNPFRAFAR